MSRILNGIINPVSWLSGFFQNSEKGLPCPPFTFWNIPPMCFFWLFCFLLMPRFESIFDLLFSEEMGRRLNHCTLIDPFPCEAVYDTRRVSIASALCFPHQATILPEPSGHASPRAAEVQRRRAVRYICPTEEKAAVLPFCPVRRIAHLRVMRISM